MRIDKFLSDSFPDITRKIAKSLIKTGRVKVGNIVIKDPKYKINNERVYLDDVEVVYKQYYYFVLYKPKGYITATKSNEPFALELINHPIADKLFPAGRLDKDVEGLVIFTNDGNFAHTITSPKHHLEKEYEIEYNGEITVDKIRRVKEGLKLKDYVAKPAELFFQNDKIHLIITEGKYHQVKEMMDAIDIEILNLKRIRIGKLTLGNLREGEWREIDKDEIL